MNQNMSLVPGLSITSYESSDPEKDEQRSEYSTIMVPNREV